MVYRFLIINHKTIYERGVMERNMILERRRFEWFILFKTLCIFLNPSCCRGKELDLYGLRPGSSTCVTKEIAAEVSLILV